jgi:hypothetical protein
MGNELRGRGCSVAVAHFEDIFTALNLNDGMTADSSCWLLSVQ